MNTVKKIALAMIIALPAFAHAGEAKVKWHDFNDYRDVNQVTTHRKVHFIKMWRRILKNTLTSLLKNYLKATPSMLK